MNVVLLEDIRNLGYAGAIKKVKDGYARNYLIPQNKAMPATKSNLRLVEEQKKKIERQAEEKISAAEKLKNLMDGIVVEIEAKVGEKGKLFGSVAANDIYEKLKGKSMEIDKRDIQLPKGPIKEVGEYDIKISIYRDIKADIKVIVKPINE